MSEAKSLVTKAKGGKITKLGDTGAKNQGRDEKAQSKIPAAYEQTK
jgi:hypothetical protein